MQTFFYSVQTIIDRLGKNAIPVQIPIGKEDDFKGLIDLFEMDAYYYKDDKGEDIEITSIPDDLKDLADKWRENLVEKICELDDDLMMMYLEGETPSKEQLKAVLRKEQLPVKLFLYSAVLHIRTKVYRSFLTALSSICRLLQMSLTSQVLT